MNLVVVVLLCALIQGLDAVYVDIRGYRGYIQRTHNNLRALEGAADMKFLVRSWNARKWMKFYIDWFSINTLKKQQRKQDLYNSFCMYKNNSRTHIYT